MNAAIKANGEASVGRRRNPRGQGERLRDEIVEAASALLAETGDVRQLTLRGVAKRVGIAATSVYLHFPDVERLAWAVVERRYAELTRATNAAEAGIADPGAALLARCRAYCRFALEHPGHYRVMFEVEPPARDFALSPARPAFEALVRAVARCVDAGAARHGDDPFRLATLVWVALHGLALARIERSWFPWPPLDEMVDDLVRRVVGLDGAEVR